VSDFRASNDSTSALCAISPAETNSQNQGEKVMFQQVHQYGVTRRDGRWFRPRAYGEPRADGLWDGWLVFFPLDGGLAIASSRETTQSSFAALGHWAAAVSPVYLEGALDRALSLAETPAVIAQLLRAEYEALADAEQHETAAELERVAAKADQAAADIARDDADELREQRLTAEAAVSAQQEAAASHAATVYERPADLTRAEASAASRRRRSATAAPGLPRAKAGKTKRSKRTDGKK
jgi:hypothetical protein